MPKPFNFSGTVGVCITRGGPPITVGIPEALPLAGVDQGDGTAALLVVTTSSASGTAQTGTPINQYTVAAMAAAVQVTQATPASTRFSVWIKNIGNNTIWVGPAGVTAANGWPVYSGENEHFPVGSPVPIYAYSTSGSVVATMEFQ
jgi:hypothetical protein